MMQPLRTVLATVIYPFQWLAMRPVLMVQVVDSWANSLAETEADREVLRTKLTLQSQRALQVDQLTLENRRLRDLLDLRVRPGVSGIAAQAIYDAADPYSRKIILDKGSLQGLTLGAPVLDDLGVLGQITRLYPLTSEVTLITDHDHATPVLNARTGARGVAYGENAIHADAIELRFMAANADVAVGDLLTTSGVDGVYPPGLPVARVEKVERSTTDVFARIYCMPLALVAGAGHVLVLAPLSPAIEPRPASEPLPDVSKPRGRR
jgi:rod shape-determining protein MreC